MVPSRANPSGTAFKHFSVVVTSSSGNDYISAISVSWTPAIGDEVHIINRTGDRLKFKDYGDTNGSNISTWGRDDQKFKNGSYMSLMFDGSYWCTSPDAYS